MVMPRMGNVTVQFAGKCLEDLIRRAHDGEEIIIVRGKTPVARLTALTPKPAKRSFGAYRGEFEVPGSFFDPLLEAELEAFEGGGCDADPRAAATDSGRPAPVAKGSRRGRGRKR
jgi:antitoxin (DNA-binding transcriptional repressor) of toxin-antitoxin stability system